jgi:NADPH:quinone reductase-like Zn-dependent oxidoreductase
MADLAERLAKLSPDKRARLVEALARSRAKAPGRDDAGPPSARWEHYCAVLGTPGHFDGIRFREMPVTPPGPGQIQIRAHAVSLNFRDLMIAMGLYPPTPGVPSVMGSDYAGEVVACGEGVTEFAPGDAVMALSAGHFTPDGHIVDGSHFAATLNVSAWQAVRKPANLSFEAAAGVPTVFLTSYYALTDLGRLSAGERVLIHSATGGVGLAAIEIARWIGAEMFATAGSDRKREYLASLGIGEPMDSRSTAFADRILARTGGEGVDVVLNTLSGEAAGRGIGILRPFGRFLQIDKQDIARNAPLALGPFKHGLTFAAIDLSLFLLQPQRLRVLFAEVTAHLESGHFAPVVTRAFPIERLAEALTLMSRYQHVGKLVLTFSGRGAHE